MACTPVYCLQAHIFYAWVHGELFSPPNGVSIHSYPLPPEVSPPFLTQIINHRSKNKILCVGSALIFEPHSNELGLFESILRPVETTSEVWLHVFLVIYHGSMY